MMEKKKYGLQEGDETGKRKEAMPRFDLIPVVGMRRLSGVYAEGLVEYDENKLKCLPGEYNWQKGGPRFLIDVFNHITNHMHLLLAGDTSEDHAAKCAWGFFTVMWYQENKPEELAKALCWAKPCQATQSK